jgi:regulator of sigma E protease
MDYITPFLTKTPLTLLAFLFVLTVVVFIHEYGHFKIARLCGVRVETFSVGFGKELFGFNDKHGTRWKFCLIPLGGYVKFFGDASEASTPDFDKANAMSEEDRKVSFFHKPVWQRAAIVAAGPIANFILAIVIFSTIFMTIGKQEISPRVDSVLEGGAAHLAGMTQGDIIRTIEGKKIARFSDMQRIVVANADVPLIFEIERGDKRLTLTLTPQRKEVKDAFGNMQKMGQIGIKRDTKAEEGVFTRMNPLDAVSQGVEECRFIVEQTFSFLGRMIKGTESADQLGGPIRIAQASGQAANIGFTALILLMAVLSVSIGLVNLFPVPMLDGGHLVFYAIEAVKGSPLAPKAQDILFRVGFGCLIALMLFTTFNDVKSLLN